MDIIQYYQSQGFAITSDPNTYYSGVWGLRNYTVNGYNYDSYCNGYHRAYDLASYHGAPIRAFTDMEILSGTNRYGNFGGTVVVGFKDIYGKKWQMILGHVNRTFTWRIGQKVKKGTILCYQSNTHNQGPNVSMASHLHLQVQPYGYLPGKQFVCNGVDPKNIIISGKPKKKSKAKPKKKTRKKNTKKFNKYGSRKARNKPYFKAVVKSTNGRGAAVRRWSGGTFRNTFTNDLPDGSIVYVYQTITKPVNGWARVYSRYNKGWVHLDQLQVLEVYD